MSDQNPNLPKSENESNIDAAIQQEQMTTNLTTDDFDLKLPKMPAVPKVKMTPEPISPVSSGEQDDKSKSQSSAKPKEGKDVEPFIEPPEVFDNVGKDFAPLKHTSMLTEKDKVKKEDKKDQKKQKPKTLSLEDFEIVSDETERGRNRWRRTAIISGAVIFVGVLVGIAFYKWRGRTRC